MFLSNFEMLLQKEREKIKHRHPHNHYLGIECHENSSFILQNVSKFIPHVPFQYQNLSTGVEHCMIWKSGTFFYALSNHYIHHNVDQSYSQNESRITSYSTNFTFVNETWANPYAISVNDSTSIIPWLSFNQLRHHLNGFHFVFQGDSMVRQIFLRMIWHIRGLDIIIEQSFHRDAYYTFNASHDMLSIGVGERESVYEPTFTAEFIWDPVLENTTTFELYVNSTNVVYVVSLLYWELRYYRGEILEKFRSPHTLFVSIPSYGNHKIATMVINYRNGWFRNQGLYLPLAEMAETQVFLRNKEDGMHFQCSSPDGPVKVVKDEPTFKAPSNKDCRDMINLNLVMILAHYTTQLSLGQ